MESGNRKWIGFVIAIILISLPIIGLHWFVSVDDLKGCEQKPTDGRCAKADAIVVVSGGDTRARTDEAVELYKNGWAPKLIVSGAAQDISGPSNAEAMRKQALEEGVPSSAILLDEAAKDTNENAIGAADLARQHNVGNVIVVTSPYHLVRATIVFKREFAGLGNVRSHPSDFDNNWPADWWLTGRGWWLVSTELVKTSVELTKGAVRTTE